MPSPEPPEELLTAVRGLQEQFGVLIAHARRTTIANAERLSPGLQPGTYKVFTTIARHERVTLSELSELLLADKGQLSRTVRELEGLGLVARAPDPADGRSSLLSATADALRRLDAVRAPGERALVEALKTWPLEDIHTLTRLLRALPLPLPGTEQPSR